ncbi:hypothetical protein IGB42_02108 [Andreprevotia sp. IGB-42]|uniref:hypothetical protein n=1 Tax=Andreprevotia sp. IGB-42 TaxID=2497473 RepID=UPI00135BD125|nr:hypothetical protein [Andreprevotia sp. IGB-42]KAF0813180.1 hypothetical protein IGB42_02108 [Andreprevotia sp. IGB-42]
MSNWESALQHAQATDSANRKNARSALAAARERRLSAQQAGDELAEARALLDEARSHWEINQFEQSLRRARSALRLLESHGHSVDTARAWQQIATALLAQGKLTKSLQAWLKSLAIAGEQNLFPQLCESYLGIGNMFLIEGAPVRAELAFRYAYDLSEDAAHDEYICKSGLYLLSALTALGWHEQAWRILHRLQPLLQAHPAWSSSSHCDYRLYLATCQIAGQQLDEAEATLADAVRICRKGGLLWGHTRACELQGRLRIAQERHAAAVAPLAEAISMASYFDNGYLLQNLYLSLSDVKAVLGDHAGALAAHELFHEARLRLLRDAQERSRILDSTLARRVEMELHLHKMRQERSKLVLPDQASETCDPLTGFSWHRQHGKPWPLRGARLSAMVLVVVRNLWEINLQLQPMEGDRLLQMLGKLLQQHFSAAEGIRFGGSVLAVLMDDAALAHAPAFAAAAQQAPAMLGWPDSAPPAVLTLAWGSAQAGEGPEAQLRRLLIEAREPRA